MKHLSVFAAGLRLAVLIAFGLRRVRKRQLAPRSRQRFTHPAVDLNTASVEQLVVLGLERTTADRIIEGRPYRNKLELITRLMVPSGVYSSIKNRVTVSRARDAVKVAS